MMTTLDTCKSAVALILLIFGACDAFVVDLAPSKPALLTRIQNFNSDGAANSWWDTPASPSQQQQHQGHTTPASQQQQHQGHTQPPSQQQQQQRREEYPPVGPEVSQREEQLELDIQELKTKLGRVTAKQENIFVTLLDVSDNLARALQAVPAEEKETNDALKALCEGVQMTEKRLDQVFEMSGIVKYGAVGELFDHNIHHALCEYTDPEMEPDTVGHIIKAGYLLNERVLRYAEVAVIKSEPSPSQSCELAY